MVPTSLSATCPSYSGQPKPQGGNRIVIPNDAFPIEPWQLRETRLSLDLLAQSESLFALSNGHVGFRGNLDEGEPAGLPGTYLNGVYESRPLPYAEGGYGFPESGETVINVTNGKIIRLLVDDEPFDLRYGTLENHERTLDFRHGVLRRDCTWRSPARRGVRITSTRLVSLQQRAIAAINFTVTALEEPVRLVLQSELKANEQLPAREADPRIAAVLKAPLVGYENNASHFHGRLLHTVKRSQLKVAASMDHLVKSDGEVFTQTDCSPDLSRLTISTRLGPGEAINLVKFLAYGWSQRRSFSALRDQVDAALVAALDFGWQGLIDDQDAVLADYWDGADVEVDGDPRLQQAVRFGLFHILQAGARAERRAIPAKGLTGTGYDGHCFWDTETFVLPVVTHTAPHITRDALIWRHSTLPAAKDRATQLGLRGAAFPWRTITGQECSGYWPASTAAFHLAADIADAAIRYANATGDQAFIETYGLPLLVETARLWMSLGHNDHTGFRIDGVTGPDEYSAIADNNVYTNLMAQHNLVIAANGALRYPDRAKELDVSSEEIEDWTTAAMDMVVCWDPELEVHPQSEGYTLHQPWDFASTRPDQYPLMLHFPYFDLYRKQVIKQADVVLAMYLRSDAFSAEQKRRNFDYYEQFTVRDSSLSACTQAVLAAEVGHLELAHCYATEAALMDIGDLESNTADGLHIASLAGTWIALTGGFGGMRDVLPILSFAPRLPPAISRLRFRVVKHGRPLRVSIDHASATYELTGGQENLEILHHGETLTLSPDVPESRPIPAIEPTSPPTQPPGRAPLPPSLA
jgi:alpha,alpha-trehalose phosphorylase